MTETLELEDFPGAAYDNKIYAKFSKNTIEKKVTNKQQFFEEHGVSHDHRSFLLGIVSPLTTQNGGEILEKLLEGLAILPIKITIRALGTERFQKILLQFSEKYPGKILFVGDDLVNIRKIFAASDASLFLGESRENEVLIRAALSYASLPIASEKMLHLVDDYNPNQESGTGFLFSQANPWSIFATLVRAVENFRFPYDWKTIQKSAIEM